MQCREVLDHILWLVHHTNVSHKNWRIAIFSEIIVQQLEFKNGLRILGVFQVAIIKGSA